MKVGPPLFYQGKEWWWWGRVTRVRKGHVGTVTDSGQNLAKRTRFHLERKGWALGRDHPARGERAMR